MNPTLYTEKAKLITTQHIQFSGNGRRSGPLKYNFNCNQVTRNSTLQKKLLQSLESMSEVYIH
jgi:hypothetical protein